MLTNNLQLLFDRDLNKLINEIELYENEERLWQVQEGISNCAGNLALHITGNLKHFIGAVLDNTGYERNREAEFASKNIAANELVKGLEETKSIIHQCLSKLTNDDLEKLYPINVFGHEMTTGFFLVHLLAHLSYHLGQVNYHRRLVPVQAI